MTCSHCGGTLALTSFTIMSTHVLPDADGRYDLDAYKQQDAHRHIEPSSTTFHCCVCGAPFSGTRMTLGSDNFRGIRA